MIKHTYLSVESYSVETSQNNEIPMLQVFQCDRKRQTFLAKQAMLFVYIALSSIQHLHIPTTIKFLWRRICAICVNCKRMGIGNIGWWYRPGILASRQRSTAGAYSCMVHQSVVTFNLCLVVCVLILLLPKSQYNYFVILLTLCSSQSTHSVISHRGTLKATAPHADFYLHNC